MSGPLEDVRDLAGAGHLLDKFICSEWQGRKLHVAEGDTASQPIGGVTGSNGKAWAPIKALYICTYGSLCRRHLAMCINIISNDNWEMEFNGHSVS